MNRNKRNSRLLKSIVLVFTVCFFILPGLAKTPSPPKFLDQSGVYPPSTRQQKNIIERPYKADEVLVKFKPYTAQSTANAVMNTLQVHPVKHYRKIDVHLTKTPPGKSVEETVRQFKENPSVEYAEPNYIWYLNTMPNDPDFNLQWGLNNTGQSDGTPDADIDAPEAWDLQTGSSDVVIAIIDSGVDYTHVDLAGNMWTFAGEIAGDSIDNDGNGYVDDVHGINAINGSGNPMDDLGHGTHCAGIIAGMGNNETGITGVSWSSKIMALKSFDRYASGSTNDHIECIEYMVNMKNTYGVNVKVSSNSWGGPGYSLALEDAVKLARDNDILFVAAAGNASSNNDFFPHYPSSFESLNVVAVAASDHNDEFASFSCYGYNSVDVAAPGVSVWSTITGDRYMYMGGTSMATPHVAGLAALICSHYPGMPYVGVKERLLRTVDVKSQFTDTLMSGGRINAYSALTAEIQGPFIYSLSPGATSPGVEITIEGSQFGENQGAGYVTFFDSLTASIVSWSSHQIVCIAPLGCQSGPVTVTTNAGEESNGKLFSLAGSFSGSLTEDPGGDPLQGIVVEVYDSEGYWLNYGWPNEAGYYAVGGLPTGDYYAHTYNIQGYIDEWYQDADPDAGDLPPIHVEALNETPNIDFALVLGGSITGQVTVDPTGESLRDIQIDVFDSNGKQIMKRHDYFWSDSEGHYTANGLPAGDYYVRTRNDQGYIDEWYQDAVYREGDPPPVHVELGNETPNIDFDLVPGGTISGKVTHDSTGDPLGDIGILIIDSTGSTINSGMSDSDGNYRVDELPTGDFFVYSSNRQGYVDEWYQDAVYREGDPPPVHVDAPNETSNIDFALDLGGAIAGKVTADQTGEALENISVYAYDSNGIFTFQHSPTDAEGYYAINALPTGDYYLTTGNDQGYIDQWYQDADPDEGDPPPVHVDAPNLTPNINFAMTSGGTISGIISDCDDPSVTIAGAGACAYEWETGDYIGCSNLTDSTGSYEIKGLPSGSYRVWVSQFNGNYVRKCTESPIEFVAEDGYTLDLCMEIGGSISGTISCENCSGGLISVWALSEPESDLSNVGGNYIGHDLIYTPGPYTMKALPYDTELWIYAEWRPSIFIPSNYYGSYDGNPITVIDGSPSPADIDIHIQNMGCIADYDCDGICDPGESSPNCSGSDECPYDPENDIDGDSICGDSDNCPNHHNPNQEDTFPPEGNDIGDACDCEGNFDCDMDQDGTDAAIFKEEFGRSSYGNPCTAENPCSADFDLDGVVDGMDAAKFKEDFGRCSYNNCCPPCVVEP